MTRIEFYRELVKAIEGDDMSMAAALKRCAEKFAKTPLQAPIEKMHASVSAGQSIGGGLEGYPDLFPVKEHQLIVRGEKDGRLMEYLRLLSE